MKHSGLGNHAAQNKHPVVSIVCVTFNALKTLPLLLQSVSEQKQSWLEFIIIDGNSTDGTVDLLKESKHVVDFWISEPDAGIYDAMNKSISYANGEWIIFMGADDVLGDGFVDCVPHLKDRNAIYYGDVKYRRKIHNKVYNDYYLTKLNICHQTIFYPKKVFSKYQFDTSYVVYADYLLNLQCWHDRELKFVHLNYLVCVYSDGGYSTIAKDPLFEINKEIFFKKYLKPQSYYRYLNRTKGFFGAIKQLLF